MLELTDVDARVDTDGTIHVEGRVREKALLREIFHSAEVLRKHHEHHLPADGHPSSRQTGKDTCFICSDDGASTTSLCMFAFSGVPPLASSYP
jgi:hypothetical protein